MCPDSKDDGKPREEKLDFVELKHREEGRPADFARNFCIIKTGLDENNS